MSDTDQTTQPDEQPRLKLEVVQTGAYICTFEAQVICQPGEGKQADLYRRLTDALQEIVGSGGTVGNAVMHRVPLWVSADHQPEPIDLRR